MSNGFAGEAGWGVGGDLVQVKVAGEVVKPDDGDDGEGVESHKNSSSDVDKGVVLIADPIFVVQALMVEGQALTSPAGVVQPHAQKSLLVLAEEEESSVMESLKVAVGGKEDDCYDYDRPCCEGDGG